MSYTYKFRNEEYFKRAAAAGFIPPPKIPSRPVDTDFFTYDWDKAFAEIGITKGTQFFSYKYRILTVVPGSDGKIFDRSRHDFDIWFETPDGEKLLGYYRGEEELWYKPLFNNE